MAAKPAVLLDTSVLIWSGIDFGRMSRTAAQLLTDPQVFLFFSMVSIWEMQIKHSLGKLPLAETADRTAIRFSEEIGAEILPFKLEHFAALYKLPSYHRDPFDRMLAAQAVSEQFVLISPDIVFAHYPIKVVW